MYPHFTIIEQRQVLWAARPSEPRLLWRGESQTPTVSELSSGAQRFPAAFQSKRAWLTTQTAPAQRDPPVHNAGESPGSRPRRLIQEERLLEGFYSLDDVQAPALLRSPAVPHSDQTAYCAAALLECALAYVPALKLWAPAISKENKIDAICSACSF